MKRPRVRHVWTIEQVGRIPEDFGEGDVVVTHLAGRGAKHALLLGIAALCGYLLFRVKTGRSSPALWFWSHLCVAVFWCGIRLVRPARAVDRWRGLPDTRGGAS